MDNTEPATEKKRFIESSSFYRNKTTSDPFASMKIADTSFLDEVPSRSPCPKCNKSRKYYCYTCYVAVQEVSSRLPQVNLPVRIDIIKHPKEVDGKSTSAHAAVLAPEDVKIYNYPDFPSYENENVLLIFPGKSAVPFNDWWSSNVLNNSCYTINISCSKNNEPNIESGFKEQEFSEKKQNMSLPFSKVIFIDSTWRQTNSMYNDPRLKRLPCVILPSHKSLFWRPQRGKPDTFLATIEAVYYFLVELHLHLHPDVIYDGRYDNMLFFFKHMYFMIKDFYEEQNSSKD